MPYEPADRVGQGLTPSVHVLDDSPQVQSLVQEVLGTSGYEVLAWQDGFEFLEAFEPRHPQCLLLDLRLPRMSGLEVQRRLQQRGETLPIILMTGYGSTQVAVQAFRQGAEDFLEKPLEPEALLDSVSHAIEKDRGHEELRESQRLAGEKLGMLTPREREVFDLVTSGQPSKNVASCLQLSKKTVDMHRANIMRKLEVSSLADLVRLSLSAGPTRPTPP